MRVRGACLQQSLRVADRLAGEPGADVADIPWAAVYPIVVGEQHCAEPRCALAFSDCPSADDHLSCVPQRAPPCRRAPVRPVAGAGAW